MSLNNVREILMGNWLFCMSFTTKYPRYYPPTLTFESMGVRLWLTESKAIEFIAIHNGFAESTLEFQQLDAHFLESDLKKIAAEEFLITFPSVQINDVLVYKSNHGNDSVNSALLIVPDIETMGEVNCNILIYAIDSGGSPRIDVVIDKARISEILNCKNTDGRNTFEEI
jgi:hypothetical protein